MERLRERKKTERREGKKKERKKEKQIFKKKRKQNQGSESEIPYPISGNSCAHCG